MKAMKENLKKLSDVVYVPCGMWKEEAELRFRADGSQGAKFVEDDAEGIIKVPVNSVDNICAGDKVTLIKMDIEGSELAALQGSVNVIKRDRPRLAICIYHKPEDLYEIPLWVKQTIPEYKLYIRHHSYEEGETVLYATL